MGARSSVHCDSGQGCIVTMACVFVSCSGLLSLATFTAGLWLVLTPLLAGPGWSSPTGLGLASRAHGPLSTQTPDKPGTCAVCRGVVIILGVGGAGDARVED